MGARRISSPVISLSGEVAISSRPLRIAATTPSRSCSGDRKLKRIAGGSAGSADLTWIEPGLSERRTLTFMVMPGRLEMRTLLADPLVKERRDRDRGIRRLEPGPRAEIHADRHRRQGEEALAPQRLLERLASAAASRAHCR